MGRINFSQYMIDRKGITDRVTLNNMTLMNWEVVCLPMDGPFLNSLAFNPATAPAFQPPATTFLRPATVFRGTFNLSDLGDTYLDLSLWKKGVVWVNGHNLGRYWEIDPQRRLFCPAPFLKKGANEIIVFDLRLTAPATVRGLKQLED